MSNFNRAWLPDLVYIDGRFERGRAVVCDHNGNIIGLEPAEQRDVIRLKDRALLPGLINAHSHAFQRVIRGRTEYRTENQKDSFWTWRELMYSAASRLSPEDIYDASRMAFLEMALGGITAVGEFHYLHHAPDGTEYDDPNLIAKQVIRAAHDVGLRIALLRVAYARAGFQAEVNARQARFIESDPQVYLKSIERLKTELRQQAGDVWVGIAPHSVRAVPLEYLKAIVGYGNDEKLRIHMHVAEQQAEVSACIKEHGRSPVALLESEGLLSDRFTAVHAIHVTAKAIQALADAHAMVCACPTTERNLGDGVVPVDQFLNCGIRVALGTDSHAQIDLLEDARELEYHLRLQKMQRAVLAPDGADALPHRRATALASRLFECATTWGAESIGASNGKLEPGRPADFFTVDLNDPALAGSSEDDLLASIVFAMSRAAVRDVVVGGRQIISDGNHAGGAEIVERFSALQNRLWR